MGALSFLKFWKKDGVQTPSGGASQGHALMEAVYSQMEERRRHIRIVYPEQGVVGELPSLEINGAMLIPGNLSLGGFFVLKSRLNIDAQVGQTHKINMKWPKTGVMSFDARLVNILKDTYHFEFVKGDLKSNVKYQFAFERVFKPGLRSVKLKPLGQSEIPPGKGITELWISDQGDFLAFEKDQSVICYDGKRIQHAPSFPFQFVDIDKAGNWNAKGAVTQEFADSLLLFLSNVKQPSSRVQQLLDQVIQHFYSNLAK